MNKLKLLFLFLMATSPVTWSEMKGGMMEMPHQNSSEDITKSGDNNFKKLLKISRGGQLYDNWWKATETTIKPKEDHPLWNKQSTNKRSGYDTFRCKECHGWDYQGKNGAYRKGSHYTGFKGILQRSSELSLKELEGALKGELNKDHDFTEYLGLDNITDLAYFMKKGLINTNKFIGKEGLAIGGNSSSGSTLFKENCAHMCHGKAGLAINFGGGNKSEFVATVANKNPWEFIHKVRNGQPGTRMPSAIINKWSDNDILNLLVFAQALPNDASEIGWWESLWGEGSGYNGMMQGNKYLGGGRGFGPKTK
ncbi:MAG: c-type cytochrome [Bermanella sp.]